MKKHKNQWQRRLTFVLFIGLLLDLVFPAGLVLAQAAPIGSLRAYDNVVTATTAELRFSFSAAGYFRIDYGVSPGSFTLSSSEVTLTNTSYPYYSITLSGLSPSTPYYYRLATRALTPSTAEWGYTGESTFTTSALDTTAPTVSGIYANYVTEVSVNINFTLNESGYAKIEYGPNNSFTLSTGEYSVPAGGASTTGIGSLTAGTTYSYRIVARDSAGNSSTSATYTFTTTSVVNCFVKVNGSVINSVIATDRNNCYSQTSFGSNNCSYYNSYFHEGSNTLEQYFGQTDRVNNDTCVKTTADTTAPSLSGIYTSGITANSIYIYFTASESGSAKVEYGPNYTYTLTSGETPTVVGTTASVFLTGLSAGTTYSYRVVARDSAGNSSTSVAYTFTTTSTSTTGCTGINLTLTKSSYALGENVNYTYTCTPSGTRAEYVAIQLVKPDQTATTYNYSTNIDTSTMGFSTSNLAAGSYTLRACFNSSCSPVTASAPFTIVSAGTSGCTGLSLTLANNKTSYTPGETVNWTVDCLPTRVTGQFTVQYVKPDGSIATQLTATGVSGWPQSYGLATSGFALGTYTLRACLDSSCSPAPAASTSFTITSSATTSQSSPIGWWKFDGNGNNEVAGGPSAATVGNASFKSSGGALGGYGYIPSSSDYFRIPYNSIFDLPESFTVEFWFRQRTNQSFNQDLVYKGSPTNNYNFKIFRYLWNQYNNGAVIAGHTAQNTSYWTQASNPNEPAHNVWHHVAYTKSSTSQTYYIDGVLIHSKDFTQYTEYSGPAKTPAVDIIVGDSAVDTDIDNLKIYNRALSAGEVSQSAGSSTLPPADATPPTVTGISASGLTSNSAYIYFNVNEAGYAKVEYGPNYTYTLSTSEVSVAANTSSSVYLSGLITGSTYGYRVVARDSAGNSTVSGSYTFTTTTTTTPTTGPANLKVIVKSGIDNSLVAGATTSLSNYSFGGSYSGSGTTGSDGSYTFSSLASGNYNLGVSASSRPDLGYISSQAVNLTTGTTTQEVVLPRATTTPPPTPTIAFGVDVARLYPQNGSSNVPVATPKIQVEFTKAIDQASVTTTSVYLGFLGAATATSLPGKLDIFSNGFNFILSEPLKAGVSYNFTIRGTVRAASGESLGGDYTLTFTTAKATETTGQGVIKGTVRDSHAQPVGEAYVSIWSSNYNFKQSSQTTAYGEYGFNNLAAGTYTLEAYPPSSLGGLTRPAPVTVTVSGSETIVRDFVFTFSNAAIKGTVMFSDNTPVADAEVSAYRREGGGWVATPTTTSGSYSLIVQPGSWMVSIRPKHQAMAYPAASMSSDMPGGSSWIYTEPPREVYIGADSDVKVLDFIIPRQTSATSISGTLQRGDNKPITAGSITVRLLGQGGIAISVPVAIGGRFTTPIAPGNYKLYVDVNDPDLSSPEIPPISIMPGEQKDIGPIIVGIASVIISGRVTTMEGRGVPRVKVSGWRANSADSAGAITEESGYFELKVSPGDWTIGIVSSPDQSYSSTAPPQFIRVVRGTKVLLVNFVLAQSDGIVNGVVINGNRDVLSDFYGFVSVGSRAGYRLPGGAPVERGQFTLRLPSGSYLLYLDLPPNATYNKPEPLPITVGSGESKKAELIIKEAAVSAVIGFLVDRDGNKVVNVPFKVFATGPGGGWFSALIDMPLGYYKLKVPPGTWYIGYDIKDNSGRYQRPVDAKKKITVAPGAIASLDLQIIEQNGRVNGVVRDNDGNSISNIWVAISGQPFSKFGRETAATQRYLNGATSDEAGQFSLPVPPGVYYVRAFVPPSLGLTNPDEQIVRVGSGEEASVELVLRSVETTISGQTTIAGVPSWAFVWAWSNKGGYTETYADERGNFKLKVSSGDIWHVSAMSELKRDVFKASEVAINIFRPGSSIPLSLDLAPLGVKLPELVNVAGQADQMTVATNDAGAKLVVPANAASTEGALAVSITPEVITPSQGADRVVGFGYEFDVRNAAGQEVNAFNSELTVSIPYDPRELTRLNLRPADLSLRYWDELNSTWQQVMNAIVDEINHVITGSLAHLTRFAIIAATDTTPPSAPTKVAAKVGGDGVVLSWAKPKDKDLQYVKIYRSAKKDALGEVAANNLTAATYKDSGMKRGATYYYLARAVDAAGNESTNTAAVAVGVKGKGTLGKAVARSAAAKVEKLSLKGSITDINLVASTMEIKDSRGRKTVVKFNPKTTFKKDGKAAKTADVKAGNAIDAQATKEAGVITLVSAVVTSVKVKVKAELKVSQFAGQRSKLRVKILEARGVVAGVGIEKGKEALLNIEGATVNTNGKSTPVENLIPQKNVTIEGVVENGAVTVTKITTPPTPKIKVQPAPWGWIGDEAASVAR